jgi:hypothetical protein
MSRATTAITFTCTKFPVSDSYDNYDEKPTTPDEVFASHLALVEKREMETIAVGGIPPGPVQLHVCHESRRLALKRYQRAFGGAWLIPSGRLNREIWEDKTRTAHQEWHRRKLWEKRIWVDFERDIIFVDTLRRRPLSWDRTRVDGDPLVFMKKYAKEETSKIRRLAVGGRWVMPWGSNIIDQIGRSLKGSAISHEQLANLGLPPSLKHEWLMGLDSLKELLLDDSFGNKKGTMRGSLLENCHEGADDVREDALKFLAHGKGLSQGLHWEIPELKVLRWDEWNDLHSAGASA